MRRSFLMLFFKAASRLNRIYLSGRYIYYQDKKLLKVGRNTYGISNIKISTYCSIDFVPVVIGDFCSIGPGLEIILGGVHPKNNNALYPVRIKMLKEKKSLKVVEGVEIGNDVWIASGVTILSGVKLGNGCVVMSNSTVTKCFPEYSIIGGCPARLIGTRNVEDRFKSWWNFSFEEIKKNSQSLNNEI